MALSDENFYSRCALLRLFQRAGNPATDLQGAIPPPVKKNMAAIIDPVEMGHLLRTIDGYPGHFPTICGLRLAPLLFMRPGELRMLEWTEVDFEREELRLPIERMKRAQKEKDARRGNVAHIVPLCHQALEILQALQPFTGGGHYVFPGLRNKDRPMSNATLLNALRRLGYTGDEMTVHGFRHMASTHLHELGYPTLLIEKQMAHADRNQVRAVYNHAEYLPERRKMMQDWADYLDELKAQEVGKITPIRAAG